jgi:hypothetical protein
MHSPTNKFVQNSILLVIFALPLVRRNEGAAPQERLLRRRLDC